MAQKKKTITSVPKAIRNDVKSLLKHSNNGAFQVAVVYVDNNTGTVGSAMSASTALIGLIEQARDNYHDMTNAFRAGQELAQAR